MHIATADWRNVKLVRRRQRALDKDEMLRLKTNRRQGFTGEDRGETLRLKMNGKVG